MTLEELKELRAAGWRLPGEEKIRRTQVDGLKFVEHLGYMEAGLQQVFDLAEAMLMLEEMGTSGVENCWAQCSVSKGLSSLFAWGNGVSDDMLYKQGESPPAAIRTAYEEWRK